MQVTLTHINGKPIRAKWQSRVIALLQEFELCVNECCSTPEANRWFSPDRVDRLHRGVRDALHSRQGWYNNVGLSEWLDIVHANVQELEAKLTLLELSGQL